MLTIERVQEWREAGMLTPTEADEMIAESYYNAGRDSHEPEVDPISVSRLEPTDRPIDLGSWLKPEAERVQTEADRMLAKANHTRAVRRRWHVAPCGNKVWHVWETNAQGLQLQ